MLIETVSAVASAAQSLPPLRTHHFYANWVFWQGVIAFAALVLSQFHPLVTYFRPGRLKVDLASKIFITHTFGNPNINFLIGLRNVGAREARVLSLWMSISRWGDEPFRLDARDFQNPGDTNAYLLLPFVIGPRANWVRHYLFYRDFDPQTDKEVRANKLAVSRQIRELRSKLPSNSPEIVSIDEGLRTPFEALFEKQFRWLPGEYRIELHVETEPASANLKKSFRFVLFEGDTEQLRDHVLEYATGGGGILWSGERPLGVSPVITEAL